jgi:hypothetical protein
MDDRRRNDFVGRGVVDSRALDIGYGTQLTDLMFRVSFSPLCDHARREERGHPSRPNKSLQPTATAVTPPAAQEIVPAVAVAEH